MDKRLIGRTSFVFVKRENFLLTNRSIEMSVAFRRYPMDFNAMLFTVDSLVVDSPVVSSNGVVAFVVMVSKISPCTVVFLSQGLNREEIF